MRSKLVRVWSGSLWVRLTAAFAFIVFLGASGVIALLSFIVSREFELYVTRDSARWAHWLAPQLAAYYTTNGSWQGVDAFVFGSGGMPMMMGMGMGAQDVPPWHQAMMADMDDGVDMWTGMGLRVVVADPDGRVVADTSGELLGEALPQSARPWTVPVQVEGETVGLVAVAPLLGRDAPEMTFLQATTRAVLIVALGIGLVAVGVAGFIARQITAPLRRLVEAANRVALGDFAARVPVHGEDELARVSLAFNHMAVALEHQQRLRRQLMNDIAHELRTPLSVIQAQVEALLDGIFPPDRENLEPIYEQTVLLSRLVNDLRELALAEAGELQMVRTSVNLASLVRRVAESIRPKASQKGVALHVEVPSTPMPVEGDAQRLEQVLLNLLDNAIRHTPSGGHVTVRVWDDGGAFAVQVRDTGPGIPPEALPHIFERFWRGDRARSRITGGSGLGLAIARQWVELHGGSIWAENAPDGGAVFTFTLPRTASVSVPVVLPHAN